METDPDGRREGLQNGGQLRHRYEPDRATPAPRRTLSTGPYSSWRRRVGQRGAVQTDAYLKVAVDASPLLAETFDVAFDTTTRWTAAAPATSASGTLTFQPRHHGTRRLLDRQQTVVPVAGQHVQRRARLMKTDPTVKTGAYRFVGLGNAAGSPTVAAPIVDGVGFEWSDVDGLLRGVVWSGSVKTQTLTLTSVQPLDANFHRYEIYSRRPGPISRSTTWPWDRSPTRTRTRHLPLLGLVVNGRSTVSPAAAFTATFMGVGDSSQNNAFLSDASFRWQKANVTAKGSQGTNALATQDLKDAGRSPCACPAPTWPWALPRWRRADPHQVRRHRGQHEAVSFVVTSGKRYRITSIVAAVVGNAVATSDTVGSRCASTPRRGHHVQHTDRARLPRGHPGDSRRQQAVAIEIPRSGNPRRRHPPDRRHRQRGVHRQRAHRGSGHHRVRVLRQGGSITMVVVAVLYLVAVVLLVVAAILDRSVVLTALACALLAYAWPTLAAFVNR